MINNQSFCLFFTKLLTIKKYVCDRKGYDQADRQRFTQEMDIIKSSMPSLRTILHLVRSLAIRVNNEMHEKATHVAVPTGS